MLCMINSPGLILGLLVFLGPGSGKTGEVKQRRGRGEGSFLTSAGFLLPKPVCGWEQVETGRGAGHHAPSPPQPLPQWVQTSLLGCLGKLYAK